MNIEQKKETRKHLVYERNGKKYVNGPLFKEISKEHVDMYKWFKKEERETILFYVCATLLCIAIAVIPVIIIGFFKQ